MSEVDTGAPVSAACLKKAGEEAFTDDGIASHDFILVVSLGRMEKVRNVRLGSRP